MRVDRRARRGRQQGLPIRDAEQAARRLERRAWPAGGRRQWRSLSKAFSSPAANVAGGGRPKPRSTADEAARNDQDDAQSQRTRPGRPTAGRHWKQQTENLTRTYCRVSGLPATPRQWGTGIELLSNGFMRSPSSMCSNTCSAAWHVVCAEGGLPRLLEHPSGTEQQGSGQRLGQEEDRGRSCTGKLLQDCSWPVWWPRGCASFTASASAATASSAIRPRRRVPAGTGSSAATAASTTAGAEEQGAAEAPTSRSGTATTRDQGLASSRRYGTGQRRGRTGASGRTGLLQQRAHRLRQERRRLPRLNGDCLAVTPAVGAGAWHLSLEWRCEY